jgi:hypothetical protein
MVELKDYILFIDGDKINFFALISDFVVLQDKLIVCTSSKSNSGKDVKDNIFAVNRNGEILWQIETVYQPWLNKRIPQIYYNINYKDDKLTAQNGGSLFFVDVSNGKIIDRIDDYGREKP